MGQSFQQQKTAVIENGNNESGAGASSSSKRLLKLYLSDGIRTVVAAEEYPISVLSTSTSAGCKLLLQNVKVHRGLFLLSPACLQLLGGGVERLLSLQRRVFSENQPVPVPVPADGQGGPLPGPDAGPSNDTGYDQPR